jgi:virulence-associated protein VapD
MNLKPKKDNNSNSCSQLVFMKNQYFNKTALHLAIIIMVVEVAWFKKCIKQTYNFIIWIQKFYWKDQKKIYLFSLFVMKLKL